MFSPVPDQTPGGVCRDEDPPVQLTVSFNPVGDNKESLEFD